MTGSLIQFKTENEIIKDFKSLIDEALEFFNIEGFFVRQLYQQINVNVLCPTVFLSVISNNPKGAQYYKKNSDFTYTYFQKQEIKIRFSALKKRTLKDDISTVSGFDALQLISEFLKSKNGINALSSLNYAQYKAGTVQNQNFIDDSELISLMPFFENEYLYTNTFTTSTPPINKFELKTYKI